MTTNEHRPRRGSDIERWIETARSNEALGSPTWYALSRLLEDYRMRADAGRTLNTKFSDAPWRRA